MVKKPIEAEIIAFYRYFVILCSVYFLGFYAFQEIAPGMQPLIRLEPLIALAVSGFLAIFLSVPIFHEKLGEKLIPLAISCHTIGIFAALAVNFFVPHLTITQALNSIWALTPVWLVILIIISSEFNYLWVVVFSFMIHLLEFGLLFSILKLLSFATIQYFGLPLINLFAFIFAGRMISELHRIQREQHNELSIANEKLKLYAQSLEDLSISRERNRIARELHDTISHTLSGTAINLEAVKKVLPKDPEKARSMLEQSLRIVRNGLVDTRRALQDLRARPLEEQGLMRAIQQELENLSEREGIEIVSTVPDTLPILPASVEHVFYRIAQEAIENIIRHSQASQVEFTVITRADRTTMSIADNGKGFNPRDIQNESHYGLVGMQERAGTIDAQLDVESKPGKGTRVTISWEPK